MKKEKILNASLLSIALIYLILFVVIFFAKKQVNNTLYLALGIFVFSFNVLSHVIIIFVIKFIKNNQDYNKKLLFINYMIYELSFIFFLISDYFLMRFMNL